MAQNYYSLNNLCIFVLTKPAAMSAMTKYFFLMALLLSFTACGVKLEPVIQETYPDGTPKIVHHFHGEGLEKTLVKKSFYYPDGKLRMQGEFSYGQKNGYWVAYFESGSIWSEGYFKDGESHGTTVTYYENGTRYYEGLYEHGRRAGLWRFWNEDGSLEKEIDYSSNEDEKG